jgi:lipoprotein NlpD
VGQVLLLGPGNGGTQAAPRVGKLMRPRSAPPAGAPSNAVPPASPPAGSAIGGVSKWVWPTDRVGAPRPVPGGGILLAGRLGQDVRAASAGRVVYAGGGLRGYGNLIIIKHADSLLSAYAHNREMLVHEGQDVAPGQVIAHMGEGGPQIPVLYFEIRLNGRPVDPLLYLSKIK